MSMWNPDTVTSVEPEETERIGAIMAVRSGTIVRYVMPLVGGSERFRLAQTVYGGDMVFPHY